MTSLCHNEFLPASYHPNPILHCILLREGPVHYDSIGSGNGSGNCLVPNRQQAFNQEQWRQSSLMHLRVIRLQMKHINYITMKTKDGKAVERIDLIACLQNMCITIYVLPW